ncbi:hypothetical protein P9G41_17095, partial [Bacillus amyloliquefaciens]
MPFCCISYIRIIFDIYGVFEIHSDGRKTVIEADDYKTAAAALQKSGYATDPDYAEKLKDVIETYKLNEFDKINA